MTVHFGTGGWRGKMGRDFTFSSLRLMVQALSEGVRRENPEGEILWAVDFDSRYSSNNYAQEAVGVLSRNGFRVCLPFRDAPLPALTYQILSNSLKGGLMVTASNNPPEYNGVKLFGSDGASFNDNRLRDLERDVERLKETFNYVPRYPRQERIERKDFQGPYLELLNRQIDVGLIKRAGLKVIVDPLFGTAREYIDRFFLENDLWVEAIHSFMDPGFGGLNPSIYPQNLRELRDKVVETGSNLGIAIDLDGDRFGILDERGRYVHPNTILALLLDYLITVKGFRGRIGKSIATTALLEDVAVSHGLEVIETPVGAKYISGAITRGEIDFGAEQSAGFWLRDHLPEKDGIYGGLLMAEMLAFRQEPLSRIVKDFSRRYPRRRVGWERRIPLSPHSVDIYEGFCHSRWADAEGRRVAKEMTGDGKKVVFDDGSWLLVRKSGTEPYLRFYAEAGTLAEARRLIALSIKRWQDAKGH